MTQPINAKLSRSGLVEVIAYWHEECQDTKKQLSAATDRIDAGTV